MCFCLFDQSSYLYARFLNKASQRRTLNRFKRFFFVDGDNTFHITNFTTLNAAISRYQTILLYSLHKEMWSCVWMGNSSKSLLLHQRDLEPWDSRELPNFPPLHPLNYHESCIFLFFFKVSTPYSCRKNVCKLTVIQTFTVPHNSLQVSCAAKRLFCGFVLSGGRNEYPWILPWIQTASSLITFSSAGSISSIIQDMLPQKLTELKIEGRKSFT